MNNRCIRRLYYFLNFCHSYKVEWQIRASLLKNNVALILKKNKFSVYEGLRSQSPWYCPASPCTSEAKWSGHTMLYLSGILHSSQSIYHWQFFSIFKEICVFLFVVIYLVLNIFNILYIMYNICHWNRILLNYDFINLNFYFSFNCYVSSRWFIFINYILICSMYYRSNINKNRDYKILLIHCYLYLFNNVYIKTYLYINILSYFIILKSNNKCLMS